MWKFGLARVGSMPEARCEGRLLKEIARTDAGLKLVLNDIQAILAARMGAF
jgi:hypothetical protein